MSNLVLVTGGNGQLATAIKKLDSDLRYKFCYRDDLDVCDPEAVGDYFDKTNPRIVINTKAYTAVDKAEDNFESAYRLNKLGPEVLARACVNSNIPLIHLSTDYVFSGESKIPYAEDANVCPLSTYGKTKLGGEEGVRTLLCEHVILRLSAVFSGHADCFPRSILKTALGRNELSIVCDQTTGPTSADSIASVLDLMVSEVFAGNLAWGTYHFAQQPFLSWYEFAQMIVEIAQNMDGRFENVKMQAISSKKFNARAPRPSHACLDSSKLVGELGLDLSILSRETHLKEAIRQIIEQI